MWPATSKLCPFLELSPIELASEVIRPDESGILDEPALGSGLVCDAIARLVSEHSEFSPGLSEGGGARDALSTKSGQQS
jgi:hypothetical protein